MALFAFVAVSAIACGAPGDPRVERLRIEAPASHWIEAGFVQLSPGTHLPSSDPEIDQVEVWIRLPDDGLLRTVPGPDGPSLALPPGTEIDRVELAGRDETRRVVDVRGARIERDGSTTFRVLRRESGRPHAALFGVAWPADDPEAHAAATDMLIDGLAATAELRAMDHAAAQRTLQSIRSKNACNGCHHPSQPVATHVGERIVARGTDASGFYVPLQMLSDAAPLEGYGAFDRSLDDPFVSLHCPEGTPEVIEDDRTRLACPDGATPTGRFSTARALADGDPHAVAMCRGRGYLAAHLDEAGRRAFADAIAACEPEARTQLSLREQGRSPQDGTKPGNDQGASPP